MKVNIMKPGVMFDPGFLVFYQSLHEKYTKWQQKIAVDRIIRTNAINSKKLRVGYDNNWPTDINHKGKEHLTIPQLPNMPAEFKIDLPKWCEDQRNQMTGPADDAALIVKMLNSGAPGVMIDLEDSQANDWSNTTRAYSNIYKLLKGTLTYTKTKDDKTTVTEINADNNKTVVWIRPRGLHMSQVLKFPLSLTSVTTSATLLDVCTAAYNFNGKLNGKGQLPCKEQPLAFYIPKTEYAEEALWWSSLFKDIARAKGWPENTIKCMALVESHSLAYEAEQFIWSMRDHLVGLNLGRWDYMASLIEQNLWDPKWVLPDRNNIPHDVAFFQNLRKHLVNVCHHHGILAIGGMTALYPSRKDAELNDRALKSLEADKKNEADMGMDGAWTGHPDQNQIAVDQFPEPNQVGRVHADPATFEWDNQPDLRPSDDLNGTTISEEGTRQAIRVSIRYRNGVLNGKGASLLDGYMEDLATDRICRLMITQRLRHLPDYTPEVVSSWFDEELARLIEDGGEAGTEDTLRKARMLTENYIVNNIHTPN
jgi:malate synthase